MKRLIFYIGVFTCIAGAYYGIDYVYQNHNTFLSKFFNFFGIAAFVFLIIWSVLRLKYGKNWIIGSGKELLIGSDLIGAMKQTLEELPKPSKPTLSLLGAHLVYRFTRIGIIGLLIASIPIVLLWQQNKKLDIQNDKMDIQNNKINIQNALIEAERRSSLVFLMNNVLDKVDDEIKEQQDKLRTNRITTTDSTMYTLSKPLINRIVALSKTFQPYRKLDGDTLSNQLVSPERGQLLSILMQSNLDAVTQNTIARQGNFSKATVGLAYLRGVDIRGIDLSGANLRGIDLSKTGLWGADFWGADLSRAYLREVDFRGTRLSRADLSGANLSGANLSRVNLRGTDLSGANLSGASFVNAELTGIYLSGANLSGVYLGGADLHEVDLSETNLSGACLIEANLSGADFRDVDLSGADLSRTNLHDTNITKKQLLETRKLLDSKGLSPELKAALEKEKPCLFTKEGCR